MSDTRRPTGSAPIPAQPRRTANPGTRWGQWGNDGFQFNSEEDEALWRRSAYRQSVNAQGWQNQHPVDDQTEAAFEVMPELVEGKYFRGPDGRHRPIGPEQREAPEVARIRRRAFAELANSGVTWAELGTYDQDAPHPGEDEAIALATHGPESKAVFATKARDMGALPETKRELLGGFGQLNLDPAEVSKAWSLPSDKASQSSPVLVANSGKLTPGSLPKGFLPEPKFLPPAKPAPDFKGRRMFVEELIGVPANDNRRRAANENQRSGQGRSTIMAPTEAAALSPAPQIEATGTRGARSGGVAEPELEFNIANRLFNWRRNGGEAPAPAEFAVHAASDEGRFSYMEDMKDEWSRLLPTNPEAVFRSMTAEVEKLSVVAQRDFLTSYHRPPSAVEIAQIDDAVAQVVFAPAQRWSEGQESPGGEPEAKPYFGIIQPVTLPGSDVADVFSQAARVIAQDLPEKSGGRPGSSENRKFIAETIKKLAEAIKACGGSITGQVYYGTKERFIHSDRGTVAGGSYADGFLPFTVNGRPLGVFVNQSSTYADGFTLKPNEVKQIWKLIPNIAHAMREGNLAIEAAGVGYFPKRRPKQSMEEYLRNIDKFVASMINCKRPFLIKVRIENHMRRASKGAANDDKK